MLFEYAVRKLFDEILAQFKMGLRGFRKFIFGLFVSAAPFLAGFGFGVWLLRLLAFPVECDSGRILPVKVSNITRVFWYGHFFLQIPAAVAGVVDHIDRRTVEFAASFNLICKLVCNFSPFSKFLLDFLLGNQAFQNAVEVRRADCVKRLVLVFGAVQFVKLQIVIECCATSFGFLKFLAVEVEQLHAASDGGLRKTGLFCDLSYGITHVEHHLEALRLLIDGQIAALHILNKHGLKLLALGHFDHHARQLRQARNLRGGIAAVTDDDGKVRIGVVRFIRNDRQVLQDAAGLDACGKLRQITEILARIVGVWEKTVDCDIYDLRHL